MNDKGSAAQYRASETAWCPGCGNFAILETMVQVLTGMEIPPSQVLLVGGIGQAAKLNQYVNANGLSGLHGRALPAAVGAKIANHGLTVIVNTGDGDSYGEGGNHFLHNIRRNVDVTHLVHNNQIYGLTKGQPSPTSDACAGQAPSGGCNSGAPFNPMAIAIAAGATFVARTFTGRREHMAETMAAAIAHRGYALVDILQPCVSFNKVNTYAWYDQRIYTLKDSYSPEDKLAALACAMEWGDSIPIGILYRSDRPDYHGMRRSLFADGPLVDRPADRPAVERLLRALL